MQVNKYRKSVSFLLPFHNFISNRRIINHKHHNPKQIVPTLTFELERRLKVKVDEVGLLLRHLYGYNSVCFLKQATPLMLPGRLNLVRIDSCFKNTRHFTQTKGRSLDETEAPPLKVWMRGLIAQSKHFT